MTPEQLDISVQELRRMLDHLAAQAMEHARNVADLTQQLDTLRGDLEIQWQSIQTLRSETEELLSSDLPKTP